MAALAEFPLFDPDMPKLTHLAKARPRNPKQHAAKRGAIVSECLLIENATDYDDGLDLFYSSGKPRGGGSVKLKRPVASPRRFSFHYCVVHIMTHNCTLIQHTHTQLFNGLLSETTRVGWYQKKHSPTHTRPDNQTSFIIFLHLQRTMASSLFSLRA